MSASLQEPAEHGPMSLLATMTRTRLELAGLELETYLLASIGALVTAALAIVLCLVALVFIGVAVLAFYWDTHRMAAATGATIAYITIAVTVAALARARWRARPEPFATTMQELELDREAMRDLGKAMS